MKILIINENRHNSIGGIEKYTKEIAKIFHNLGHDVYEFSFNFNPERNDMFKHEPYIKPINLKPKTNSPLSIIEKRKNVKDGLKIIDEIWRDFDIIINQSANIKWNKEIYNSNKWIFIQHFNPNFYKQKYTAGSLLQPIIYFGMNLVGIRNPFKVFKNFVIFSEADKQALKIKKANNVWINPLPNTKKFNLNDDVIKNRENKLVYWGRFDNRQKRIKYLVKWANQNKINVDLYGTRDGLKYNTEYTKYINYLDEKDFNKITKKYKYSILLSKYEGFPFSIVESLSLGLPPIMTNCCPMAKEFTNNKGFLFSKKINDNIFNIDINKYKKLCYNSYNFSGCFLSKDKFEKKWKEIISVFK